MKTCNPVNRMVVLFAVIVASQFNSRAHAATIMPTALYSTVPTSSTSDVPGFTGVKFTDIQRPYRSPDGTQWVFEGLTDLPGPTAGVIVVGSGLSGTVVVQQGVTPTSPTSGELVGPVNVHQSINNSGDFVFYTNTNALKHVMDRVVGGAFSEAGRQNNPAPGIAGATYNTFGYGYITEDGRVGFHAFLNTSSTSDNQAVYFDGAVIAQKGVSVPTGQATGATNTWETFDSGDVYFSDDGANVFIQGDTNASSSVDDIVTLNGAVVIQEGTIVPGSGFTSPIASGSGVGDSLMTPDGTWFVSGRNTDGTEWVVRNGNVIAVEGDPVPGSLTGELFAHPGGFGATVFDLMTGNNLGHYVYIAGTSSPDSDANVVLVFNNTDIIAREGDPIDLDGNPNTNDDAYIEWFEEKEAILTDGLRLYFIAELETGAGGDLGPALLYIDLAPAPVPEPGAATLTIIGALGLLLSRRRR